MDKITPALDVIRNILLKLSEILAPLFSLDSSNVYFFLILIVSIWSSKRILEFFYTTLDGRKMYWLILAGIIFWILKYLGVN